MSKQDTTLTVYRSDRNGSRAAAVIEEVVAKPKRTRKTTPVPEREVVTAKPRSRSVVAKTQPRSQPAPTPAPVKTKSAAEGTAKPKRESVDLSGVFEFIKTL
jgi:hypothetical protein